MLLFLSLSPLLDAAMRHFASATPRSLFAAFRHFVACRYALMMPLFTPFLYAILLTLPRRHAHDYAVTIAAAAALFYAMLTRARCCRR